MDPQISTSEASKSDIAVFIEKNSLGSSVEVVNEKNAGVSENHTVENKPSEASAEKNSTPEIVRLRKPGRSNSQSFNRDGLSIRMGFSQRNIVGGVATSPTEMKDALIISIISLEAGAKFYKTYHQRLEANKNYNSVINGQLEPKVNEALNKNVSYTTQAEYHDAFRDILQNKEPAHCVSVIEGPRDNFPTSFTSKDANGKEYQYSLHEFKVDGKNCKGHRDEKQNISFYVRTSMEKSLSFDAVDIPIGDTSFQTALIKFSTQSEQEFAIMIVHLPNKLTTSQQKCEEVHAALEEYAEKRKKEEELTLLGYVGDTNYKKAMKKNSNPSYGGNQGENYLSPTSSGAKKHTDFMQANCLLENPDALITQPSTLNHVKLTGNTSANLDHPSVQTIVLVNSEIKNETRKPVQRNLFATQKPEPQNSEEELNPTLGRRM